MDDGKSRSDSATANGLVVAVTRVRESGAEETRKSTRGMRTGSKVENGPISSFSGAGLTTRVAVGRLVIVLRRHVSFRAARGRAS